MADEIPISAEEQAFFDAMRSEEETAAAPTGQQHQEQSETDDAQDRATPEVNGEHEEQDETRDSGDSAGSEEEVPADASSRNSGDEAQLPVNDGAHDDASATPVPYANASAAAVTSVDAGDNSGVVPEHQPKAVTPPPITNTSTPVQAPPAAAGAANTTKATTAKRKKRLPQDVVGQYEDRIADDPKGDVDAWLGLIEEYKRKGKHDDARAAYERFFVVFPTAVSKTYLPTHQS
jgi:cleavage stimulation factor subunit 3